MKRGRSRRTSVSRERLCTQADAYEIVLFRVLNVLDAEQTRNTGPTAVALRALERTVRDALRARTEAEAGA